jgi:radical SAM superfamily enzyme YgiQ (UPF0313 family)
MDLESVQTLLNNLSTKGESFVEERFSRILPGSDARVTASQIVRECKYYLSQTGSGKLVIGQSADRLRYTLFFKHGRQEALDKVSLPYRQTSRTSPAPGLARHPARILLVNLKSPGYPHVTSPTAIVTLGGYLKHTFGELVCLDYLDLQLSRSERLLMFAEEFEPDIVGLSVQIGAEREMFAAIDMLQSMSLAPIIVVGNVVPTYASDRIHQSRSGLIAVIGSGEPAFKALVSCVLRCDGIAGTFPAPNSSFVIESTIYETGSASSSQDWRVALPDWIGLFKQYKPHDYDEVWMEASRGCPWKRCSFCAIRPNDGSRAWIPLPTHRVLSELELLAESGVRHVRFADEEFMAGQTMHALELAEAMRDLAAALACRGRRMPTFDFAMRVDDVFKRGPRENTPHVLPGGSRMTNNEIRAKALDVFRQAGLSQVYLGIESGSLAQLKRMRKGVTPDDNRTALERLRQLNISVAAGWIMIDPLMKDIDDLRQNIAFLEHSRLIPNGVSDDFVTNPIQRMRVLEGSPLVETMRRHRLLDDRKAASLIEYDFSYLDPRIEFISKHLTSWEDAVRPLMYAIKWKVGAAVLNNSSDVNERNRTPSLPEIGGIRRLGHHFFELKRLDFEFVKSLVTHFAVLFPAVTKPHAHESLRRLESKRGTVLQRLHADIECGRIEDDLGTLMSGFAQIGFTRAHRTPRSQTEYATK